MSVLKALWLASIEREELLLSTCSDDGIETLLSDLRNQRHGSHKKFGGPRMEFLVEDGMTCLPLRAAIRTEDFYLREKAIRHLSPNCVGYHKNK